jgi:hypothetical protein
VPTLRKAARDRSFYCCIPLEAPQRRRNVTQRPLRDRPHPRGLRPVLYIVLGGLNRPGAPRHIPAHTLLRRPVRQQLGDRHPEVVGPATPPSGMQGDDRAVRGPARPPDGPGDRPPQQAGRATVRSPAFDGFASPRYRLESGRRFIEPDSDSCGRSPSSCSRPEQSGESSSHDGGTRLRSSTWPRRRRRSQAACAPRP